MRQITAGPACSVASTGIVITPDGNAVASSPSRPGRAPEPPELKVRTSALRDALRGGLTAPGRSDIWKLHRHPAPSAGTPPGTVPSSAPSTTSGSMCPITWRSATGASRGALTMDPSGAVTAKGARLPALFGTSGAIAHLSA